MAKPLLSLLAVVLPLLGAGAALAQAYESAYTTLEFSQCQNSS